MTTTPTSQETIELFNQYVIPNYRRYPVTLVRGEGSYVWNAEGERYLDLFPGWGCNILGYCPPKVVEAVQKQVADLIHVPNTWYIESQGRFAEALCTRSFGKAFFCNSGAEAIEGAIKLARLHTRESRHKIITFENGFHGRTYAAVTATAQPKYHEGIGPMVAGFRYAPHNDLDAVASLIDDETAAILIEPVQGEGGVNLPEPGFLEGLRELCNENELLLIFDEVQTGMGRLGTWFGHQQWDVQPDIMTLAKGLAGGVAAGAIIATDEVAPSLRPGHARQHFWRKPTGDGGWNRDSRDHRGRRITGKRGGSLGTVPDFFHRLAVGALHHSRSSRSRHDGRYRPDDPRDSRRRKVYGTGFADECDSRDSGSITTRIECDRSSSGRRLHDSERGPRRNGPGRRLIKSFQFTVSVRKFHKMLFGLGKSLRQNTEN